MCCPFSVGSPSIVGITIRADLWGTAAIQQRPSSFARGATCQLAWQALSPEASAKEDAARKPVPAWDKQGGGRGGSDIQMTCRADQVAIPSVSRTSPPAGAFDQVAEDPVEHRARKPLGMELDPQDPAVA